MQKDIVYYIMFSCKFQTVRCIVCFCSMLTGAIKDSSNGKAPTTPDSVVKMVQEQIKYLLHDSYISKARKMLVIEQFRNQELANLQTKQNYTDVMIYFTALIKSFTEQGALGIACSGSSVCNQSCLCYRC